MKIIIKMMRKKINVQILKIVNVVFKKNKVGWK